MRNTKQKELVLNIVKNSYNHDSANDIYEIAKELMPNISLGTIYRILNEFEQMNIIKKIHTSDNIEHYDYIRHEHYHFICNNCKEIKDLDEYDLNITDFKVEDVIFYGLCDKCVKEEK